MSKNIEVPTCWIFPNNPKKFDVDSCFKDGEVYWRQVKQTKDISVGDIVFIYVSKTVKKILFQCEVVDIDHQNPPVSDIKGDDTVCPISLKFTKKLENADLGLQKLRENGLKGTIRGPRKLSGELKRYVLMEAGKI